MSAVLQSSTRGIAELIATPWHAFGADSGAWTLHPARQPQALAAFDPFVMVDHFVMPDAVFAPHPHAGFSAVTYLFEDSAGGVRNRDSFGTANYILPGALHWTQAGRGMVHEELPLEPGRAAHGLQIFVNSARANKNVAPAAFHVAPQDVPVVLESGGAAVRVVLGAHGGVESRIGAHTPVTLLDITLPPGGRVELPLPRSQHAFAIVVRGGLQGVGAAAPHALRFDAAGDAVVLAAGADGAQVVLLAGEPLREPVLPHGPFVGNSAADVAEMIRRYQAGEMGALAPTVPA
ncbi:MAG TPA: pirin-like C-terminal cupin domain-containing protein [Methylibium sp.]|nr:pirin-like C-terminal cupin domain-containing protein [Methylibium sp.]